MNDVTKDEIKQLKAHIAALEDALNELYDTCSLTSKGIAIVERALDLSESE